MPFTVHVTLTLDVPVTVAAKLALWPVVTPADAGDTVTAIGGLAATVMVAVAACVPAVASTVTGLVAGAVVGAVYVALSALVFVIVPTLESPPVIPFTLHVNAVPGATQSDAARFTVAPVATLDDAGEIEFAALQEILRVAVAAFVGSAILVAVTATDAGEGGIAGAVYAAVSVPLTLSVPSDAFPPLTPFTVQLTADVCAPAPLTVAIKFAVSPGVTAADVGAMLTRMPL